MAQRNCGDAIYGRPRWQVRLPAFNEELARYYVLLGLSGDKTIDWILDQVWLRHEGKIYEPDGTVIDLRKEDILGKFGEDPGRWMNEYKNRAFRKLRRRLQKRCQRRVFWMDVARSIHERRAESSR